MKISAATLDMIEELFDHQTFSVRTLAEKLECSIDYAKTALHKLHKMERIMVMVQSKRGGYVYCKVSNRAKRRIHFVSGDLEDMPKMDYQAVPEQWELLQHFFGQRGVAP